jgi:hypothetical protein
MKRLLLIILLILLTTIIISAQRLYFDVGAGYGFGLSEHPTENIYQFGTKIGYTNNSNITYFIEYALLGYSDEDTNYYLAGEQYLIDVTGHLIGIGSLFYPIERFQISGALGLTTEEIVDNSGYLYDGGTATINISAAYEAPFNTNSLLFGLKYDFFFSSAICDATANTLSAFAKFRFGSSRTKPKILQHTTITKTTPTRVETPIVSQRPPSTSKIPIVRATENATNLIKDSINENAKIAIVNITARDADMSDNVVNEIEFILVNNKFTVIDRSSLDVIRKEQQLQLSGEVDDNIIVNIGKFAGANVVITGEITGASDIKGRIRLRALDTQTAKVLGVSSEPF